MSSVDRSAGSAPWVRILERTVDYTFASLFRVVRTRLQHRLRDGGMSPPLTRISFERGDSVAVLLHDPREDVVLLVRQFRYPVYEGLAPVEREGDGARAAWIVETVAGVQGEDEAPDIAQRELLEEAGYRVEGDLEPLGRFYVSPGGTSERIHLFLGEVDRRTKAGPGGGLKAEGEDIEVVPLALSRALDMVRTGEIRDAKTIIALQHLALRQAAEERDR